MYDRELWFESPIQPAPTQPMRPGLAGLGSVNQLAVDMPDQTVRIYYGITTDLDAALSGGGKPQRPYNFAQYNVQSPQWGLAPNGYYAVRTFMGGWLLDGCPLNVIFGLGWQTGQQAALMQAGISPSCPQVTMQATAPIQQANPFTTQPPSQTFVPAQGPIYTPAVTASGIVYGPSPAAPQTQVVSTQTPPLPTDVFSTTPHEGGVPLLPSWVPIAAVALIVAVMSRR